MPYVVSDFILAVTWPSKDEHKVSQTDSNALVYGSLSSLYWWTGHVWRFSQWDRYMDCLVILYMLANGVASLFLVECRSKIGAAERLRLPVIKYSVKTTENYTWAFHWIAGDPWLDICICLSTLAFCAYSCYPLSFVVEVFFCLKVKLIAKPFHTTILNIKGYVFLHNFFCMNSVQCYLSEVAGKLSAESLKNAFECCLWAEMMRNEYSQSLIINFSLSWQYWHLLVSAQMDESQLMSCFDHLQC